MIPGTPAHKRFVSITMQKVLLRDLEHVSPAGHTYNLESYHSMLIRFAPKSVAFTGPIMHARFVFCKLIRHICKSIVFSSRSP